VARAKGFIYAAGDVIEERRNHAMFRAPILHLLAHGAELLFKGVHLWHGATPEALRRAYGHDLWLCWSELPNEAEPFREVVEREARDTWARAEDIGMVPEDSGYSDGWEHFTAMLRMLSDGNTGTDYAWRYPKPDQQGMVPLHLRDTLAPAAAWAVSEIRTRWADG
jgi:hypothetical protein